MSFRQKLLVILILSLGLFLRVWRLNLSPVELFGDEIDIGIQAKSIVESGRDYLGHRLPIRFQSFDELRLPFAIYATAPFVAAKGLSEWTVRLPAAIAGWLSLVGFFLMVKELFGVRVGLISLLLLAISPWHIQFSRWANDAIPMLALVLFGTWSFLVGLSRKKYLILPAAFFAASLYAYSIAAIFVPMLAGLLVVIYWEKLKLNRKYLTIALVVGLVMSAPFVVAMRSGLSEKRFSKISVVNDPMLTHILTTRRSQSTFPLTRVFRNKLTVFVGEIAGNYLRSFSNEYLFVSGDPNLRHSVGGMGEMYGFEVLTIISGCMFLAKSFFVRQRDRPVHRGLILVCAWLLMAPMAAALTKDGGNHAGRLIAMVPALVLLSAIGLDFLWSMIGRVSLRWLRIVLVLFATFGLANYLYTYHVEWPKESWRYWQYGYKEAVQFIKDHDEEASRIYMNNSYEPALPRFLFWYGYDMRLFQKQFSGIDNKENVVAGFNGFHLGDKYYFGKVGKLIEDKGFDEVLRPGELYLVNVRDEVGAADWITYPPKRVKILKTISSPLGEPIFFIITKKT